MVAQPGGVPGWLVFRDAGPVVVEGQGGAVVDQPASTIVPQEVRVACRSVRVHHQPVKPADYRCLVRGNAIKLACGEFACTLQPLKAEIRATAGGEQFEEFRVTVL